MTFQVVISDDLKKTITLLKKRDQQTCRVLTKKMLKIASSDETTIQHFKNIRGKLKEYKRVHIGSYVLLFHVKNDTIIFQTFEHHDKIYEKNQ